MPRETNWHTYAIVLVITLFIFGSAYLLSQFFYEKRLDDVRDVEQSINLNVLATEVDYALLADAICESESNVLSDELSALADKLSFMEDTGENVSEIEGLKKYYSLLQIKDYLLNKEKAVQCGIRPPTIMYFYSNAGNCADCRRQGYVLDGLRRDSPELRIYAFDYNLDLSVIRTLRSIYHLTGELPALVVNRIPHYGFKDRDDLLQFFPELTLLAAPETSSTSSRE